MSFILARANSLRFPCSTPELTNGMGMSLVRREKNWIWESTRVNYGIWKKKLYLRVFFTSGVQLFFVLRNVKTIQNTHKNIPMLIEHSKTATRSFVCFGLKRCQRTKSNFFAVIFMYLSLVSKTFHCHVPQTRMDSRPGTYSPTTSNARQQVLHLGCKWCHTRHREHVFFD